MQSKAVLRAITIDYSDDELDALSEAFTRRDIARRERAGDAHDPIRRAQNQTALRGLVARRAITLGGSPGHPRITFLEPHATLLGAFLGADAIATVRHQRRSVARAVSLFAHGDHVVEQAARERLAIQRMTAHARAAAPELLRHELALSPGAGDFVRESVELTGRMMSVTTAAIAANEEPPGCVPDRAADILFAQRSSGSVTITSRDRGGTRSAEKWSWIDAGDLGVWRVEADGDGPILRLLRADPDQLTREIGSAWHEASKPGQAS